MKNSKAFLLNKFDFLKGLIVAVITAVLTALYQALSTGVNIDWRQVLTIALTCAIGYLLKQFGTKSDGNLVALPKSKKAA